MNDLNTLFFLRHAPKSFAKACIHLLNDYELCKQIRIGARVGQSNDSENH